MAAEQGPAAHQSTQIASEGRSLAAAAAWSGYRCKPAARLTRSASLLMTQLGRQYATIIDPVLDFVRSGGDAKTQLSGSPALRSPST
jgi:hypothetical protein